MQTRTMQNLRSATLSLGIRLRQLQKVLVGKVLIIKCFLNLYKFLKDIVDSAMHSCQMSRKIYRPHCRKFVIARNASKEGNWFARKLTCAAIRVAGKSFYKQLKINELHFRYKDEINCPPCFHPDCAEKNQDELKGQNGEDYCNICFVEGLKSAPCIRSSCGHFYHLHCIQKKIETK